MVQALTLSAYFLPKACNQEIATGLTSLEGSTVKGHQCAQTLTIQLWHIVEVSGAAMWSIYSTILPNRMGIPIKDELL